MASDKYLNPEWVAIDARPVVRSDNFGKNSKITLKFEIPYAKRCFWNRTYLNVQDHIECTGASGIYADLRNVSFNASDAFNRNPTLGSGDTLNNTWNIARVKNHIPALFKQINFVYQGSEIGKYEQPHVIDTIRKRKNYNSVYLEKLYNVANWKSLESRVNDCKATGSSAQTSSPIKSWMWSLKDLIMFDVETNGGQVVNDSNVLLPGTYTIELIIDSDYQKVLESRGKLNGTGATDVIFPDAKVLYKLDSINLMLYMVDAPNEHIENKEVLVRLFDAQLSDEVLSNTKEEKKIFTVAPTSKRLSLVLQNSDASTSKFFSPTEFTPYTAVPKTNNSGYSDISSKLTLFQIDYAGQVMPYSEWKQLEDANNELGSKELFYQMNLNNNKDLNEGGSDLDYESWKNDRLYSFLFRKRSDDVSRQVNVTLKSSVNFENTRAYLLYEYGRQYPIAFSNIGVPAVIGDASYY